MLVVLSGLPGVGKTTIGRIVAERTGAVSVRVDVIEQALVDAGVPRPIGAKGYVVAYALAADLLGQGFAVVAECVNPLGVTRDAWRAVARECVEVELVCSDAAEHERRATTRASDVESLVKPSWDAIVRREYEPWDRAHVVVDTAGRSAEACADEVVAALEAQPPPRSVW